ncbi:4-carboxymuconolactone decarboxylase [Ferrithrix thermotolerans DSM 19514]|uniref:4-carboxymuconolactone decarboxylase n=1 Tax=Ferrithrix thermotolerans DSM 19514 TaxID=1121881 RepID=A0A1M4UVP0_9ACTN|nr:carboxymuconolactone decarboxylase family protein [Ferrithrix thermotolerans]SHE60841.1 4-carboxymuconolactone decarboxylase [Ferrithrix thermotolerans DSM 19514]
MGIEDIKQRYESTFGKFPESVQKRFELAKLADRLESIFEVESLRKTLLAENPLPTKIQQLVHFGQLLALGAYEPAEMHAKAAVKAGATPAEMMGVLETTLITAGMPRFSKGVEIVAAIFVQEATGGRTDE